MEEQMLNNEALQYLDEAMFTSSLISKKDRAKGQTDWDNVYPRTKAETQRMAELLEKANEVVEDPNDEDYRERYNSLAEIVDWSQKRHRTWMWSLIAGALLGAGIFYYYQNEQKEDIARAQADVTTVEGWSEQKLTASAKTIDVKYHESHYSDRLSSPNAFKSYTLSNLKDKAAYHEKSMNEKQAQADTASTEEAKEKYLERKAYHEKNLASYQSELDSVDAMNYEQLKAYAIDEMNSRVDREVSHGKTLRNYMIYLLILIPLYIITGYPHGYTITRHTRRTGCLNIFRKVGFAIASFCFGAGLAMSLLPDYKVKTYYSDGSTRTHTEGNVLNFLILFLKFGLMIIGAFIFCFVSSIVMTVETISGLYNNFNWSGWFRKLVPARQAAQPAEPAN